MWGTRHPCGARFLDAYLDAELGPETAPRVADHVARCPDCFDAARLTQVIKVRLRRLGSERPMNLAVARLARFAHEITDR